MPARGERSWAFILTNYVVAGALLLAGILIYAFRQGKSRMVVEAKGLIANLQEVPDVNSKLLLICCWLLCPIVLPFIFSILVAPIYTDRYTICAAPALYLLIALCIFSVRKVTPIPLLLGVLAVMILAS